MMLDRDPNPSRPPDPPPVSAPSIDGALRHRPHPRHHRAKNAPKRQPQRGLGVAQLEKLRLEEQSKQEAASLASFNLHLLHQQQAPLSQQHHRYQHQHQHQAHPLQIKPVDTQMDKFPTSCINKTTHLPFSPLSRTHPLPLHVPPFLVSAHQQQLAEDGDANIRSPLSQAHDICSPDGSVTSFTLSSSSLKLGDPVYSRTSPSRPPMPLVAFCPADDSTVVAMQNLQAETCDSSGKPDDPAMVTETQAPPGGEPGAQRSEAARFFTDLCLSQSSNRQTEKLGALPCSDVPSTISLQSPVVSNVSTSVQARELSSFQIFSLSPTRAWFTGNQVCNRKRPWMFTQEPLRSFESLMGVDLNISADEVDSDSRDQDGLHHNVALGSCAGGAISGAWGSLLSAGLVSLCPSDDFVKPSSFSRPAYEKECSCRPQSMLPHNDYLRIGSSFLTLSSGVLDEYHAAHIENGQQCGGFLTLGPSRSSSESHGSASIVLRDNATICQPKEKGHSVLPRQGDDRTAMTLKEDSRNLETSSCLKWIKFNSNVPNLETSSLKWTKFNSNVGNETLDLELRLSR